MIHHVQIACPAGSEEALRAFYVGVLGMAEKVKPPILAARGGCWFTDEFGAELHLGVEEGFQPARKAHPALIRPDLDDLAGRLEAAGYAVTWGDPAEIPGVRRFHSHDCHGNRLEFMQPASQFRPPASKVKSLVGVWFWWQNDSSYWASGRRAGWCFLYTGDKAAAYVTGSAKGRGAKGL